MYVCVWGGYDGDTGRTAGRTASRQTGRQGKKGVSIRDKGRRRKGHHCVLQGGCLAGDAAAGDIMSTHLSPPATSCPCWR